MRLGERKYHYTKLCLECASPVKRQSSIYCSCKCKSKHSPPNLGKKHTEETKRKIGLWGKGRIRPEEECIKISLSRMGSKNPAWKGGITTKNQRIRASREYEKWRIAVFQRDNYTCQICKLRNGNGKTIYLNADHIKPFSLFPDLRFELSNGRTLCLECHKKTDTYKGKIYNYAKHKEYIS